MHLCCEHIDQLYCEIEYIFYIQLYYGSEWAASFVVRRGFECLHYRAIDPTMMENHATRGARHARVRPERHDRQLRDQNGMAVT